MGCFTRNIADHDHNYFFDASAALGSSVTSSFESSDDDNPEPAPEHDRRSRGGGCMRIEAAAGESDDDGVFSDRTVLEVASIILQHQKQRLALSPNCTWFEGM